MKECPARMVLAKRWPSKSWPSWRLWLLLLALFFPSCSRVEENLLRLADPSVRKVAVEELGRSGDARAVPALIERLSDPDVSVANAAADGLRNLGSLSVEGLIGCMQDEAAHIRRRERAATLLGEIGDTRAVEPLRKCVKTHVPSEYEHLRSSARRSLVRMQAPVHIFGRP